MSAMDRIRDEMAKKSDHPGISILGEYFTARLLREPALSAALESEKKTLEGAFNAIYEYAKKHKTGNYAFIPPEKGYEIACGYYGIAYAAAGAEKPPKPADSDLDLDALLS